MTWLMRFFAVVLRSRVTLAAMAVLLLGMAAWMARYDPHEIGQLSTLALVAQMFAAASGFREPARKGRFDPVLTRGTSRLTVAAAHWIVSIAPGVLMWIVVVFVILWVDPSQPPAGGTPSGVIAILYVSSASWLLALPLTRYASGLIWILALVVLSGMNAVSSLREAFLVYPSGVGEVIRQSGAALVCPFFLVTNAQVARPAALSLVLTAAMLLAGIGALFIARLDVPLQDQS